MIRHAGVLLAVALLCTATASAQGVEDLQALAKWAGAKLVHFHIEGLHQGDTGVVEGGTYGNADVTDHLTMDFDYWLMENKVEGPVRFQNSKSVTKTGPHSEAGCAILKGEYEHLDAKEVTVEPGQVKIKGTRSFPAADVAFHCPDDMARTPVAAKQEPVEEHFNIQHPATLLMGGSTSSDIKVAPDKKSYTMQVGGPTGWAWTFTPTILK